MSGGGGGTGPGDWQFARYGSPGCARLLRAMHDRRHELLEYYPGVPVPAAHRTPVAALLLVWQRWSYASGTCPMCGGLALATSFGGLLSTGSVSGACTRCGAVVTRWIGGLVRVIAGCRAACEGTRYRIPFGTFPGGWSMSGEPKELLAVLGELGEGSLPNARDAAYGTNGSGSRD